MFNKLMSIVLIVSLQFIFAQGYSPPEGYNPNSDFSLDWSLNAHSGGNATFFSDFQALGAQSVLAGMDFDGDGLHEILFSMDETLAPGGPDPGYVGVYLYEKGPGDGGGFQHVWHFVSPDWGNSLPGMFHGDIDGDGLHEIYFGVPPAVGSNDDTWGTYIFEQDAAGVFPDAPTLLFQYGMTSADNFRPAGYALGDVDGDGKVELCTVDRGTRKLSIDALATTGLDEFSTFTNEFLDTENLGGGSVYNVDVVDFDMDGNHEVWVNTWDNFSMAVFEAQGTDTYALSVDLNSMFADGDPASFRRNGFAFYDADGDGDSDAWFPMTNGKLYYLNNTLNDTLVLADNQTTNGGFEDGTTGWGFYPDPMVNMAVVATGDTMANTDSTFTAFEGTSALKIMGLSSGGANMENNAFFLYTGANAIAQGSQFVASAEFYTNSADDLNQDDASGVLFAKYFGDGYSWIGMESESFQGMAPDEWHNKEVLCTVPAGATIIQVGVMHVQPNDTSGGSFYVDDLQLKMVTSSGVDLIVAGDFSEVLTFGERNRGSDMGDIDGDGKMDIIANTGTKETVMRMEFMGGDPTNAASYDVTTIFESVGEPADRYYPLDISDNDLDGDGYLEVVLTNLYAADASQPQILVLDNDQFIWDYEGGNETSHLAANWSIAAVGLKSSADEMFQSDPTGNSRTAIGGMDMDQDGAHEVIATDYVGHRVLVWEYDAANNAFDVVWASPEDTASHYSYNPRTVGVGDLDNDGKEEIVFPLASTGNEGWWVFEWDGVVGSDNYGTTYSSINRVEVDTCCEGDGSVFRGDHERTTIADVDGDGQQELVIMIRRGGTRGTLITSVSGDIEHNAGGAGFETWVSEFFVDRGSYGGGSPYHSLPADLNGDGHMDLVNHTWNYFNFYNTTSTGPDAYSIAAPDAEGRNYATTYPSDQVSLFGGAAGDIDGDGNDEAYFSSYGNWGVGTGDVYVVDYDEGDDVLTINEDHVRKIGNAGTFHGAVGHGPYDGSDRKSFFVGRGRPNVSALEYIGPDPRSAGSYMEKVIYWGELDVTQNTTTIDSNGTTTVSKSQTWGFASKITSDWNGVSLDFDMDNKKELLVSFQNNRDSLTHTTETWDATGDTFVVTTERVANPKAWTFVLLENQIAEVVGVDPMAFIVPEDYRLEQNYPNPFNPNTTIQYTIPINRKVSVKVYNITGQLVKTLVNNELVNAGTHKVIWNGQNEFGRTVSTGMYLYSLEWAGMKKVKRMTLVK